MEPVNAAWTCAKVGHDVLVEYDPPIGPKKRVRKRCTRCGVGLNWRPFTQDSFKAILEESL